MKRTMIKKLGIGMLLITLAVVMIGCGSESEESNNGNEVVTWKLATDGTFGGTTASGDYTERVKALIEEKSNGTIQVDIYAQGELGDATQQAEMLQTGSVDLLVHAIGNYGGIVPETQVFTLHHLLSGDTATDNTFLNGENEGIKIIEDKFKENSIVVLSWWSEGTTLWSGNKPLNTLESWEGVKMRTIASPIIVASFEAYGANPTSIPFTELYSALQLNTVDGQANAAALCYGMKYHEVQSAFVDAKSDAYYNMFLANDIFYDGLTEEQKNILSEVAAQMEVEAAEMIDGLNDSALEAMKSEGAEIYTISDEEKEKFIEASTYAYDVYVNEVGGDAQKILDLILEDVRQ